MVLKAAFLDIDGTLVDSNEFHVIAWAQAFRESGHSVARCHTQTDRQRGRHADPCPAALPRSEGPQGNRGSSRGNFPVPISSASESIHQAAALIAKLHADRTQVLLASSAKDAEVEHYVRLLDVQRVLTAATSADDVANSKPAGDIFASALRKVTPIQAEEAIAIGNTPYDVLAAGECNIRTITLLSGGFSKTAAPLAFSPSSFPRPRTTVAKRIEARRTLD
jgi:beta-phosphoglucomutase-like phosphatase (HAD superfamily)